MKITKLASIVLVGALSACAQQPTAIDWTWGPVMPMAKSARATTAMGPVIYTVGGTWWETAQDQSKTKHWLVGVEALDTYRMAWSRMPTYPVSTGYAFAATIGKKLYVCGGRSAEVGNVQTFIMNPTGKRATWQPGPALPQPRWGHDGGAIGSVIYIVGGFVGDPAKQDSTSPAEHVLALDTNVPNAQWRYVADMPNTKTKWVTATACAGKLYLFCEATDEAFVFDPNTGKWRNIAPPPTPLGSGAATAIDDRYLLLAGGTAKAKDATQTPDGQPRHYISNDCFLYDVVNDRYTSLTPLKQAVLDQGLVCIDGTIYSLGGEESPHRSRADLVQVGKLR